MALVASLVAFSSHSNRANARPLAAQSLSVPYLQNFDSLTNTGIVSWTNDETLPSWYAAQSTGVLTTYRASTGSSTTGALYSYGSTGSTERALGSLASGTTGLIYYGVRFHNDTGVNVSGVVITYTGEQWRTSGNTAQHKLDFAYCVGSVVTDVVNGTWTNVDALDFIGPITGTTGALDGNVASNRYTLTAAMSVTLTPNQEIMFRWLDSDDTGNDHGLAIDDLSIVGLPTEANLSIDKTGPYSSPPGASITYTIRLSNTGTFTATSTRITDTLPPGVTFVTYSTALSATFSQLAPDTLIWDVGDISIGATGLRIDVQTLISPSVSNGTLLTNSVQAATATRETITTNNTAQATTLVGAPDVAVVKTGPATVNAGDTLTFTLTYGNDGNLPATGVVLVDQLPSAMSYVSDSLGSSVMSNGVITWNIGSLNGYVSHSVILTATAVVGGDYQNRAAILSADDVNPANNTSNITVTILGANPYVSKSSSSVLIGGQIVSYTITYGNPGNQPADVTITDTLPIGFTAADIAVDTSNLNANDSVNTRSWTTTIGANAQLSFTLALTVPASIADSTRVTNTIEITSTASGNDPSDDVSSAPGTVYQFVPIAAARAGSNGQIFAIEGQVTYVPGTYDPYGWAVQDSSGGIAVVYAPAAPVALNDLVRLAATRDTIQGEEQLRNPVYYFQNLGPGPAVSPIPYSTGAVSAGTTEGWLVVITGTVSSLGACTGDYQFLINDGSGAAAIFVDQDTGVNVCAAGIANGDWIRVTGFSTQANALYEVKPRRAADVAEYPRVLGVTPANNSASVPITTTVKATFNLTVTNVNTTTFSVQGSSGAISGTVNFDIATRTATFTPTASLAVSTRYTATLKSTVAAGSGLTLMPPQDYAWSFVTHQPAPQLAITKTAAAAHSPLDLGEVITYTFTLSNTGDAVATTARITDTLPVEVAFGRFIAANGAVQNGNTITWGGNLNAGAQAQVIFTATVMNNRLFHGRTVTNTVQFTSGNGGSGSASIAFAVVKRYFIYLPLIRK
jgi:uncharacterized repeat protein (TIGR01451 family)